MAELLPAGKLPAELLARLLRQYIAPDPRLVVGPAVGEDAAVIDFGRRYLVAKTDPITFASDEIGWYAVNVNANDIACSGGTPRWFLASALLPAGQTDAALAERIFGQLSAACAELSISLVGGHTEITDAVTRPVIAGLMLGELAPADLIRTAGARVGDAVLLTKGIAIEGTAIIARERAGELAGVFEPAFLARCRGFLRAPGISVVRDAAAVRRAGPVHALHDPTEGGLATALYELATAAGVGLRIERPAIHIFPETEALCRRYGLDPLGLIASGALLATVPAEQAPAALAALERAGVAGRVIGRVMPADYGVRLCAGPDDAGAPMPIFARDEIARLFEPG
jgi:hydrogenase expression/formation protein HypE